MSTFVPLLNVTLTGATSEVHLSGLPQTYSDLVVIASGGVTSGANIRMRVNNDKQPSVYREQKFSVRNLNGTRTVYADRTTISTSKIDLTVSGNWVGWGTSNNDNSGFIIKIPQYSSALQNKQIIVHTGSIQTSATNHEAGQYICQYVNTDPITSLVFFPESSDTFKSNTTFSVYGIGLGSPKALGGNIVTTDGSYWYHAFTSTGVFEPLESLTSQYLIVAGGGGGGGQQAGGGGAGGVRAFTGKSLTAQKYIVSVGAGGRGGKGDTNLYITSGSNTSFNGDSVTGGGYGGSNGTLRNGANGGSGGGGGINNSAPGTGNAGGYSPVEGYAGGAGGTGNSGAGGGGAGAAGEAKASGNAGDGGVGIDTYNSINFSTWLTNTRLGASTKVGGGGGGGANSGEGIGYGGQGGGGNGSDTESPNQQTSQHGVVNTGGGGGGGPQYNAGGMGGNGGSGLVIVRYPV